MKLLSAFLVLFFSINIVAFSQTISSKKMIDTADMDQSIRPNDDFFLFANGNWIKKTAIPPSKTRWGAVDILSERSSTLLKSLAEYAANNTSKGRNFKMVGDLYTSGMDSINAEKLGYQPIKKDLERIAAIKTVDQVITEIAYMNTKGITFPLFNFGVYEDSKINTQYITHLNQGGIVLPDRDYYLKDDKRSADIRKEYRSYITDLFIYTGTDSAIAAQNATNIIDLETKLAGVQLSKADLKDPIKTYNKFSVDDFSKELKTLNLRTFLKKMLVTGQDSIISDNPVFIKLADSLLSSLPIQTWKNYLQWYILKSSAAYLSDVFVQRNFQYGKALSGQKSIAPRWQRVTYTVDNRIGDMLGQLYVKKYFTAAAKKRMLTLVNNLQEAFKERIKQLDWMSDATKEKALLKLAVITKKVGYPDKWKDYAGVVITKNNYLQNIRNAAEWNYTYNMKRLGKPIDTTEWYLTPPTVNAYYAPVKNEIVFPAGILQPPFFDFEADDAFNYGSIGAIIGHEMTHGFDDDGRKYDANGNLNNWWTEEDAIKFTAKSNKIIEQYDALTVLDTIHVNGKLTSGENIADIGGLSIAYTAFKKTAEGRSTKKIEGYTPDQRFFLSFAQTWRSKILPERAAQLIIIDAHSPAVHRTNETLKNMDAFYKAFNIQPGDKMYKLIDNRIRIW